MIAHPVFDVGTQLCGFGFAGFVDNQIDAETGTVQGRAIFPNRQDLLVPGMFAEIQLLGAGPYEALLIPDEAIGFDQAQQFLLIVDEGDVVQRRTVQTGRMEGGLRIILNGLERTDRVIISGLQRARAGAAVSTETVDLNQLASASGDLSP